MRRVSFHLVAAQVGYQITQNILRWHNIDPYSPSPEENSHLYNEIIMVTFCPSELVDPIKQSVVICRS